MALFISVPAHADLYRWVDPDSGSVKFSSLPPNDPRVKADVVTGRSVALPPKPAAADAALPPVASLESRWREMVAKLVAVTAKDVSGSPRNLVSQVELLQALRAELDRGDPAGAAKRQEEQLAALENVRQALASAVPAAR